LSPKNQNGDNLSPFSAIWSPVWTRLNTVRISWQVGCYCAKPPGQ